MKQKTKATSIPQPTFATRDFSAIKNYILYFISIFKKKSANLEQMVQTNIAGKKRGGNMKKFIPLALLIIIIGGVITLAGRAVVASSKKTDTRQTVNGPRATFTLNKDFSFPITDSKGKEVTRLKYTIESAELRDEIIVKGARATAIKGRTFLILNIKIVNDYDKGLDVNARDYVRLVVNGNENELQAADIHNDPVSVQPISTKFTRIGFPINDTDKNPTLKVGEIKGEKQTISLNF